MRDACRLGPSSAHVMQDNVTSQRASWPLVTVTVPCLVALRGLVTTGFPFPPCLLSVTVARAVCVGLFSTALTQPGQRWADRRCSEHACKMDETKGPQRLFNPVPRLPPSHRFGGAEDGVGAGLVRLPRQLEAEQGVFPPCTQLLSTPQLPHRDNGLW